MMIYLQLLGTLMNTKHAPQCACLTVDYLEERQNFSSMNYQNISMKLNAS